MKFGDFFKPQWKQSDPRIRAEAIKSLDEEFHLDDLTTIAISDELLDNSRLALKKINSETSLIKIAENAQETAIRESAQKKLSEIWTGFIKSNDNANEAISLIKKVKDLKCLEDIALNSKSLDVRKAGLDMLVHASSILKVALNEKDEELAFKALSKISKPAQLEIVSKKALNKSLRQKAKELFESQTNAGESLSEEQVRSAQLELLCRTVESLEQPTNWEDAARKLNEAKTTWGSLVSEAQAIPEALSQRFEIALEQYKSAELKHLEKEQMRQKDRDYQLKLGEKRSICNKIDELLIIKNKSERNEQISTLIDRWRALGDLSEEDAQLLDARFKKATETFQGQLKELSQKETKTDNVQALLEDAKQLAERPVSDGCQTQIKDLKAALNRLPSENQTPEVTQIEGLISQIEDTIQKHDQQIVDEEAANFIKLKEVIPQIETLVDNPDLLESERKFRDLIHQWRALHPFNHLNSESQAEYASLTQAFDSNCERYREAQEWLRWSNLKKKQDICQQLETFLEASEPRELYKKLREMQSEWRQVGPVSWEASKEIWDQYRKLTDEIYEKCQSFFSELEEERKANLEAKKELCTLVETQIESTNWKESTEIIKKAQAQWKDTGPVPKEQSDSIWEQFRNLCDKYFDKRKLYFEELESQKDSNFGKKLELCKLVEDNQDSTNWRETAEIFKKAQEDWKQIGPVPKERMEEIWDRFRKACDHFFNARDMYFKTLDANKDENLAQKEALIEQILNLENIESDQEKFDLIKKAQAEWKLIGPVEKDKADLIWERFRKPIDDFFDKRKLINKEENQHREENLGKKEELCQQAETLSESKDWKKTSEELKKLQASWKQIGPAARDKDKAIWMRFRSACDAFFSNMKDHYRQLDEKRSLNLNVKEDLCFQAERLAGFVEFKDNDTDSTQENGKDWPLAAQSVKELQKKWKEVGPVPRSQSDELWQRFRMACDFIFDQIRAVDSEESVNEEANLAARREICEEADRISHQVHTDAQLTKIKNLQKEWRNHGPIPKEEFKELWLSFKKSCDIVLAGDERLGE